MSSAPQISLGIPAYNAASTIGATIESLLAQTYGNFELIVSDNASTDGTRDVVERYARYDSRVRCVSQPVNVGANANYSHTFRLSRAPFFKWTSSSDWCAPAFLERALAALDADDGAVVAAPRTRLFDGEPGNFREYAHDIEIVDSTPSRRLQRLTSELRLNNAMNGLIRSDALRRTRLVEPYYRADIVLMGHLAMLGRILRIEEPLYYRRMEVATSTALQSDEAVLRHHYPRGGVRSLLQASKRHLGWLRAVRRTPMGRAERWRSYRHVARIIFWERHDLLQDLRGVARYSPYALNK